MENKSKIPSLSHQKIQPSTTGTLKKITSVSKSTKPLPARRILSRRSNSCTDLRNNGVTKFQPIPLADTTAKKPTLKIIPEKISYVTKRPAPAAAPPVVPAKMSKGPKIPAYDYKARYNLQVEKYTILQQSIKEKDETFSNNIKQLENLTHEKNDIAQMYESTKSDLEQLRETHATVKSHRNDLLLKVQQLEEQLTQVQNNYVNLEADHQNLTVLCHSYEADIKKWKSRSESLMLTTNKLETELSATLKLNKKQQESLNIFKANTIEYEDKRRHMHNQIQDLKGMIRVFCRIRPPLPTENERLMCNFTYIDEDALEIRRSKESISAFSAKPTDSTLEFKFDKVFQPETTQSEVFEELAQLIQSAMDGYHVCVFAYGQTGSGKTYTMQGEDHCTSSGMIPRAVNLIFNLISKYQHINMSYTVEASFLEIYNETVHDLLNPSNRCPLEIRFNEGRGTTVTNLTTKQVRTAIELSQLMLSANENRAVAVTNYNEHSSRSHAVTKITLTGTHSKTRAVYVGSVSLVDLAGSESAKTSSSERIVETKNINKSLSALGTVMTALKNKDQHVPYRNSKLTYLLQSSLGGNSKTLMFVNITPFEESYNESVNALRFAAKVKEVKIISKKNKIFQ